MSDGFLLDTNVLSEVVKKKPEPAVLKRLREIPKEKLVTSAICITELRYGTARHPQGSRLWDRLSRDILSRLRILPFGDAEARRAGDVLAALTDRGKPIGIEDVLIGATALVNGFTVATRNTRHFNRIDGLKVVSWWPEPEEKPDVG